MDGVLQGAEDVRDALAGDAGQQVDRAAGGFAEGGQAGGGFPRRHGIGLVQANDFGFSNQTAAVSLQLGANGAPGFHHVPGGAVDQMQQHGAAFDVAEEAVAEAGAFVRALDQAGDVGEDEFLRRGQADDTELRVERGEGVVGDLGFCGGDDGQEGGFTGVGQADKAGVGDQLQAQPDPAFLAHPALGGLAGGSVGGGLEVGVAEAAIAATQQGDPFAGDVEVGEQGFLVVGEDLGAEGHGDDDIAGAGAGAVGPCPVAAFRRAEMLGVAEVDQGVEVVFGDEDDVATLAAVAAVGTAELDEFFPPERGHAIPAVARAEVDLGLVEELHRLGYFTGCRGISWVK